MVERVDENSDNTPKVTARALHTVSGGVGGTAGASITSFPHTADVFTGVGDGTVYSFPSGRASFQATADASYSGAGVVRVDVSNDGVGFFPLGWAYVNAALDSDGFGNDRPYAYFKFVCETHGDATNAITCTVNI